MKARSTVVLLASVVLLGAFIWIQESWRAKQSVRLVREIRLFNLNVETLNSITFTYTNGVVRCVKENGEWMAGGQDGKSGKADLALMMHMVAGLNSMGKGTKITSKQLEIRGFDAAQYGFDKPLVNIEAIDNEGLHQWQVGRKTPLGDMVYAKTVDDEDIYTISDKLLFIVPTTHDHLRDRVLFPGEAAGVRRVEIRGPSGFVQLLKDPSTGWRLQQPVAVSADPKEVNEFIEKLYLLRIGEFVADNVSDFSVYGLQGDSRQISVGSGDGSSRMLVIGDDIPDHPGFVYARRVDDTSVFSLSADVLQLLNVPTDRFRKASLLSVPLETVSSVNIERGDEHLTLAVDDYKHWEVTTPVVWSADARTVADLIIFWSAAVIIDFNLGTNDVAADWIFEIGSAEAGITNRIQVLPSFGEKDGLVVRLDDDPSLYQINIPAIPERVLDPLAFKNRQILKMEKGGVSKISVLKNGGELRQVIERSEDQVFVPAETNGPIRVNTITCEELLKQLEDVKTSDFITYNPDDLEIYGLASPSLELHIGFSNSNELGRVLLVGRKTPDGFYSMVKGRDVVFYLDESVVNAFSADLLDAAEPMTPLSE